MTTSNQMQARERLQSHKLLHLVERIAAELATPEDALSVVAELNEISADEWQQYMSLVKTKRERREYDRINRANKRAMGKKLPATLTLPEWMHTLEIFNGRCAYCERPFSYEHLEHIIPLAAGLLGTTADNCVPSCKRCNQRKGTKGISFWVSCLLQLELPLGLPPDDFGERVIDVHKKLQQVYPDREDKYEIEKLQEHIMKR